MTNERETALYVLVEVFEQGAYANIALKKVLKRREDLNQIQKSFVTELVNGTLRNLICIDYTINAFSKIKTSKMKPVILNTLRISVYQAKYMTKVPHSAICNEAVKIVKSKGLTGLSGFVNGVLRNIIRNISNISYPDKEKDPIGYLSVIYSYPEWILNYWLEDLDYDTVEEICRVQNIAPMMSICVNTLKIDKESLIKKLNEENILTEYTDLNIMRISKTSDIQNTTCFKEGLFHVMDKSSATVVEMLDPSAGDTMLDICAAPGGKSFYAAYMMKNEGKIIARDIYEHKLKLINNETKRLGLRIVSTEEKDATESSEDKVLADVVLADVPCSGLGILRKKPDAKYNKTLEQVGGLQQLQRKILSTTHNSVKEGGILVYSTCTISKRENIDNVNWFIENYPFEVLEIKNILPTEDSDGFFIAKMKRK